MRSVLQELHAKRNSCRAQEKSSRKMNDASGISIVFIRDMAINEQLYIDEVRRYADLKVSPVIMLFMDFDHLPKCI